MVGTVVAALGLLLVVVRWVSFPRYHAVAISYGVGTRYGISLALIAGIAETTAAVMAMRASGEAVPCGIRRTIRRSSHPSRTSSSALQR